MTQAKGIIVALDGDYAIVKTESGGGCGHCSEAGGCGGTHVSHLFCRAEPLWRVLNPRHAQPGEAVEVAVADGAVGAGVLLLYVLPLALFIAGAAIGMACGGDLAAIAGAVLGLALTWPLLRRGQRQRSHDQRFQPHIV